MEAILELNNITKKYFTRSTTISACNHISFKINSGESVSLLGLNGAGKTTLINIISTAIIPDSGTALVCGFDLSDTVSIKKNIGVLHEKNPLYEQMSVKNFLHFCQNMHGDDNADFIAALCKTWALDGVLDRPIKNLSKGFKQRVGVAASLVHRPKFLILDEPTSGLDTMQQAEFEKNIAQLLPETTLLLCTHDLAQASRLCMKHIMLSCGTVFASGTIEDLRQKLILENKISNEESISDISDEFVLKKAFEVFAEQ